MEIKKPKEEAVKIEEEKPKEYLISSILKDDSIVELIYNGEKTMLAVYSEGRVGYKYSIELKNKTLLPFLPNNLLKTRTILFPSEATEYGSEGELLQSIQTFIHRYLEISPFFEKLATYYVLFSWVYDKFSELPYLRALGDWGSGKSRFLKTVGVLCYRPMLASGALSTPALFRIIETFKGTLILDEADFRFSDTQTEIVKVLNQGYEKGSPVLRCSDNGKKGKNSFDVEAYRVYCPKVIASRERWKDRALESRCLVEEMEKKRLREDIPLNLEDEFWSEALDIRNKLLMWRFRNYKRVSLKTNLIDKFIDPRLKQMATPLASIIQDEEVLKEFGQFIKEYNHQLIEDRGQTVEADILRSILSLTQGNALIRPSIGEITERFNEERTDKGKFEPHKVGRYVREKLGLKSKRTNSGWRISTENSEKLQNLAMKFGLEDVVDTEESFSE